MEQALDGAAEAVAAGDIFGGWAQLHVAQRLDLLTMERPLLNAAAVAMRAEADKLNPWRRKAVSQLLSVETGKDHDPHLVFMAAALRDEHYANEAYKDGIRRATAAWLAVALSLGVAAFLAVAWTGALGNMLADPDALTLADLPEVLLALAVTGYLGAAVSAITKLPGPSTPSRIPEIVSSFRVTALRLLMGPVSAIVVYFVVTSAFYESVVTFRPDGDALLVLAFVAGFTERLVRRVVEEVSGKGRS